MERKTSLGVRARDLVTGLEGIITGRADYLNGCTQFCVKPPLNKDGETVDGIWIDSGQLEFVDIGLADQIPGPVAAEPDRTIPETARHPGGPQRDAPPV